MTDDIIAKMLLEDKNCENCFFNFDGTCILPEKSTIHKEQRLDYGVCSEWTKKWICMEYS